MPHALKNVTELKTSGVEKAPIRPFDRSLPMVLMRAREAVMQRFRPHLRKHNVTEQQWRILRVLEEEKNVDMLALSEHCMIQPPSLSRTVPLLVKRGLVRRCSHGNDLRRVMVDLTPKGRLLFRTMSAESVEIYEQLDLDIGEGHITELYGLLDELIALAQSKSGTAPKSSDE
jgi:homoprotocatechuate degradation regulator HpaR